MTLPRFAVRRPVTTLMFYLGVILLGAIAWTRLPQELFPPITYPQLTVVTHYKDAAPEEIEILITKPIEEVVGTVSGLRRVSSISKEEVSLVIAEFTWGTQMDFAALGVREKIDLIKERLPRGSEDPVVIKFNPFELPVLVFNLSGDVAPSELLRVARKQVKTELEKVEGVAAVTLSGGLEREILVEVDQGRLAASGLPISNVVESLSKANLNYPAGTIKEAFYEFLIRTMGEFKLVQEIPGVTVGVEETKGDATRGESEESQRPGPLKREKGVAPSQRLILLKDVGVVKDTFKERSSVSRFNGKENVSLRIQKQAGANTLQVATRVKETAQKLSPLLAARGVTLSVAYDQSLFIRSSIAGVRDAALQGGALAFLVLYLFLGSFWAALNVAFAIPISILATIWLMYGSGLTINVISLGGLAFGIGLLVDAGIVVVENVERHRQEGKTPTEAAAQGTEEVSGAIVGTVLTTVVVFLPMIFVVGIAGQIFKELAYTVTFSNLASLVVSLSLTALFASKIRTSGSRPLIEPLVEFFKRWDLALVSWFLNHRLIGVVLMAGLMGSSVIGFKGLDQELLPRVDQGQFILRVNLPPGTRLEVTDRVAQRIEQVLQATPEVQDLSVTIGSSKEKRAEELLETLGSHQAQILVNLKPLYRGLGPAPPGDLYRTRRTSGIVQELKETLAREPLEAAEVEYLLQESVFKSSFLAGTPVVIEVKGKELARLEGLANDVQKMLAEVPGLYGIKSSLVPPSPETKVRVAKDRAAAYHLSVSDIAITAQTALKGFMATKFKEEGEEIDLRVRLRKEDREDLNQVRRLIVHSPLGVDVPLAEVAYLAVGKGPTEIRHLDQQRTILVSAQLYGRPLSETLQGVSEGLREIQIPAGYLATLTGESEQMKESFHSLAFALALSVILVYMVMASEFESFWQPLLIMGTIPLALVGVWLALAVTGTPVSIMALLGFIVLGGIVVDNGIVLIDYVNLLRRQGMELTQALREASLTRLRPILMTAATTVLGVLPLALGLGEGVELQGPMAITVMGGLTVSTFLTLVFLPTIYHLGASFFERVRPPLVEAALLEAGRAEPAMATAPAAGMPVATPSIKLAVSTALPAATAAEPFVSPELPEIPEGFGSEEAAPAEASLAIPLPMEERPPAPEAMGPEQPPVEMPPPYAPTEGPPEAEAPPAAPEAQPTEVKASSTRAEVPPKTEARAPASLTARQQRLLDYLKAHGRISRQEYASLMAVSVPTAARDLRELVDLGFIRGVGPLARGRFYVLA